MAWFEAATNSSGSAIEKGGGPAGRHHFFHGGETTDCWQVLFPATTNLAARAGDAALVLRGNFDGTRILLMSDLSRAGQSELLAQGDGLRADIVIAGLPEDGEPMCDSLIAATRPQVLVIVDSDYPAIRRASRALKERLGRSQLPVLYTRTTGAVKIVTGPAGWLLTTMDGQKLTGKH
jgi:beta-lactamase superfamily II metal-dependent hydrolase